LSKKSIEDLEVGARIEIDQSKEDPLDFALWKFYSDPPVWDSPWGKGRPGWHIECSAMALKYFESPFEIHGGGYDLVFPHHENEIAQSESFSGKQFAKIWIHSGMVTVNSEKMSKSLGNIVTIQDALSRWGPNSIRIYSISVHYSKPLDYSEKLLNESKHKWRQIETCACELRFAIGNQGYLAEVEQLSDQTMKASTTPSTDPSSNSKLILGDMELRATEAVSGEGTRQSDSKYFHIYQNGACYEFALNVTTVASEQGVTKHVDRDKVFSRLEQILSTVKINPITPEVTAEAPASAAPETPAQ